MPFLPNNSVVFSLVLADYPSIDDEFVREAFHVTLEGGTYET